jgi:hypothetical protein
VRAPLTRISILGLAVAAAACGSSSSPSSYPLVGGQYAATYTYQLTNSDFDSTATVAATINMLDANSAGLFTGTLIFSVANDTGVVIGQFGSNRSSIQFLQFGDAGNAPPLFSANVFAALFPICHLSDSTVTFTPAGGEGISGKTLTFAGTFTSFKCGADSAASTLNVSVTATNQTGPM